MKINGYKILLIFFIILLIAINYKTLDGFLVKNFSGQEQIKVERVIDGDTVVVNGTSVRLLGINTPEKGEKYYDEAKKFLEEKTLNKTLIIERHGKDKYYRDLGYLFYSSGENINSEIVRNGYGNYYFYSGKDKYSEELIEAWEECIRNEINLCSKSQDKCAECVEILTDEFIINNCGISCDIDNWEIKVEGRSKLIFNGSINSHERKKFNLSTDNSGGNLFLRDDEGKLVFWKEI